MTLFSQAVTVLTAEKAVEVAAEETAAAFARVTLINLLTVAQSLRETFDEIPVNVQLFALKSADALTDALK